MAGTQPQQGAPAGAPPKPTHVSPPAGAGKGGGASGTAATFASTGSSTNAPGGGSTKKRNVDEIVLAGQVIDGAHRLEITGIGPEIDRQKGAGKGASIVKIKGFKDPQISIEFRLWKRSQANALVDLLRPHVTPLPTTGPSPKKDPHPIEIGHWKCDLWQVTHVVVEEVSGPDLAANQMYTIKVKAAAWRKPPPRAYGVGFGGGAAANRWKERVLEINQQFTAQLMAIQQGQQLNQQQLNAPSNWWPPSANPGGTRTLGTF